MFEMIWEAWFTLIVVVAMFAILARTKLPPDFVLWCSLTLLIVAGMVSGSPNLPGVETAVRDLGNPGLVTIGFLFVVVEGLTRTEATGFLSDLLLRLKQRPAGMRALFLGFVAVASSLLNNTAIVAMFLPVTRELSRRSGISPSQLFMPMCFAATLGGVCTLLGTSTNLVVVGMLQQRGLPGLGVFEIAWVGVPVAIVGVGYLVIAGPWLLPKRNAPASVDANSREYVVEMLVDSTAAMNGKTVGQAGLRHLPGLFLAEVERDGEVIAAVGAQQRLKSGDRLCFFGDVESVSDLRKLPGLIPAIDSRFGFDSGEGRWFTEVVVSPDCPFLGRSIRESDFRGHYGAAVLAVGRGGDRLRGKAGDVILQTGDSLLLESREDFADAYRNSRDFFVVTPIANAIRSLRGRGMISLIVVMSLVIAVGAGVVDLLPASMIAAIAMIAFRCCTTVEARQSIDLTVLLTIGAAFGIASAIESTGVAASAAFAIVQMAGDVPWMLLSAIYLATLLFTEMVTNNAAAALMFPVALKTAESSGLPAIPFVVAVMMAASCGFATPFGYQTNLMVAGPGGYRFLDYARFGLVLDVLVMIVAVVAIPLVWPLTRS